MAKDPRIDTGSRPRQLPPEAHIRMHFEKFSSFVAEYSSMLSLGGMFVVTRDPRPVGSEVAFDLKLADGFRLFHGHGEVAWVRLAEGGREKPPGMALRFVALDEKGRELVLKVLEEQVKAGGLPFEIDPPPADAILDYSGPPPVAAASAAPAFEEEPTLVTPRRRSLDETGFDAPWGQKLPEVPTDLLDEAEPGPPVPSVSEVQFAPPRAGAGPAPASAPVKSGPSTQSGLFAAAFPSQQGRHESPVDLGFVLDESPPPAAPDPGPSFADVGDVSWDLGGGGFNQDALAPIEDPLIDFEPSPGDLPFEPDPADLALSEEPTMIGRSTPAADFNEDPTVLGSRRGAEAGAGASPLPAVGIFEVGPNAAARPAAAPATPAWAAPAAPPLFESWPAPAAAAAPADPFAPAAPFAPADPFAPAAPAAPFAPADPFAPAASPLAPADPFGLAAPPAAEALGAPPPRVVAPPPIEAFTPFDLGPPVASSTAPPAAPADPFGYRPPPPNDFPAPPPPRPGAPQQQVPSIFPAGYFAGGEAESASPPEGDYEPELDWQDMPEPSRAERIKAALGSRRAIVGLALTAVLVVAAYFFAGDLLGSRDQPIAEGLPSAHRPPVRRPVDTAAGGPAGQPATSPASEPAAANPADPERVVAQPDDAAAPPPVALPKAAAADESFRPSPADVPPPTRAAERSTETSRPESAPVASRPRWLQRVEVDKSSGRTTVTLIFDGAVDPSFYRHDPLAGMRDREQVVFPGLEGARTGDLKVGSPELTRIRFGQHPGELRVVFDRPVGYRISSITPEGNRLRIVLDR